MIEYDIGDQARLTATFKTSNGVLIDPTEVKIKIRNPNDTETEFTAVRDSVGQYHYDLTFTVGGTWYYRFVGTGAAIAAGEASLLVKRSAFGT